MRSATFGHSTITPASAAIGVFFLGAAAGVAFLSRDSTRCAISLLTSARKSANSPPSSSASLRASLATLRRLSLPARWARQNQRGNAAQGLENTLASDGGCRVMRDAAKIEDLVE